MNQPLRLGFALYRRSPAAGGRLRLWSRRSRRPGRDLGADGPPERTLLERHIAEFQTAHPEFADIRISRVHYHIEDLRTQFQTAAMAMGGPNLVYGPSDKIGPFVIMDLIMPLDELLPPEVLARFDPSGLPTLDGQVWGLPDQVGNHLTLVANRALVDTIAEDTDAWVRAAAPPHRRPRRRRQARAVRRGLQPARALLAGALAGRLRRLGDGRAGATRPSTRRR